MSAFSSKIDSPDNILSPDDYYEHGSDSIFGISDLASPFFANFQTCGMFVVVSRCKISSTAFLALKKLLNDAIKTCNHAGRHDSG